MGDRRIRFVLKSFSLWLLGALVISMPLSRFNLVGFYHLKHEGVRTNGVVTKLDPGNHQAVYYNYDAAGEMHSGMGRAGHRLSGTPSLAQIDLVLYPPPP